METRQITTGFTAGEVDPLLHARVDLKDYYQGAKTLRDWCLLVQGGIRRRWGTKYLADLGATGRLEEFVYKDGQEYLLFFKNGGLAIHLTDGTACVVTGTAPWTTAQLFELDFTYAGDTIFVVHKDVKIKKVTRTGATAFTIADFTFETSGSIVKQPYFKFEAEAVTLQPSATTGSVTVTASTAIFSSSWVDKKIRIKKKQLTITAFTDSTHVTATCDETLTDTSATTDWDEQAFSDHRGYPRSVMFHEDRLCFGGSKERPTAPFKSRAGAYYNFDVGSGADTDSIQKNIAFDRVTQINHMVSHRHALYFTDGGEIYCPSPGEAALTPGNIIFKRQSPYGSNANVKPHVLDDAALFVQKTNKVVRETVYDYLQASYISDAISLRSTHLITTPIQLATLVGASNGPEQYAFFVNTDGTIAVYHSVRSEKLRGWTLWRTDGLFKSVAVTISSVFAVVQRTISGSTKYYLEKFDPDLTLDCAKTVTLGAGSTTLTGLAHLNGTTTHAVQGNFYFGTASVAAGSGTWVEQFSAGDVVAGLNYTPELETLPPIASLNAQGDASHELRRLKEALVQVHSSLTFKLAGQRVYARQVTDNIEDAPEAQSKVFSFNLRGYSRQPTVTLTADIPLPLTILAMTLKGEL